MEGPQECGAADRCSRTILLDDDGFERRQIDILLDALMHLCEPRISGFQQKKTTLVQRDDAAFPDDWRQGRIDLLPDRNHRIRNLLSTSLGSEPVCERVCGVVAVLDCH